MEVVLMFGDDDESVNDVEFAEPQEDNENVDIDSTDEDDSLFVDDDVEESEEDSQEVAEPDKAKDSTKTEKTKQTDEDNAKYAAARRESEKVARELKERQDNFAKTYGYSSFDEMEKAAHAQKYVDQGYDENMAQRMVTIDRYEKDLQQKLNSARIAEEKSTLKEKPYFKEFEKDIDAILEHNPNLSVELVFKVVKGENMDKILESKSKAIAQKTLNNINGKSHIKADGKGSDIDTTVVDEAEWKFYQKLNPKAKKEDYAKFIKSEKRR